MDYSKQGQPPPAYSQANAPTSQPYPYGQAQTPYQPPYQPSQQQPGVYPAGPGAAYAPAPGQVVVTQPGMVIAGPIGAPPPPDYLIPSILVCLFCFCPTGIVAVYYAHRRTQLVAEGDMEEAQRSANCARNLMIASFACGVAWIILVIVLRLVLVSAYYN